MSKLHKILDKLPSLGRKRTSAETYVFQRMDLPPSENEASFVRVQNVLNYAKIGETSYSASMHPAGYHTLDLAGRILPGQRKPLARLAQVPFDFSGKSVLDIGCNQGGMLFALSEKLRWGVGIDFDAKLVNAANLIASVRKTDRLSFYVFDLERDPLFLAEDFLPERRVDIVFLLSVCMWIRNWEEVIEFLAKISDAMLFETNGSAQQQAEQERKVRECYDEVVVCAEKSEDDPRKKSRRLLYCTKALR